MSAPSLLTGEASTNPTRNALLRPGRLGPVMLRNRFVFQPHFTSLGTWDGLPSLEHVAYHEARARGGVGLVIFESQAVHPAGKSARRMVDAWDPRVVPHHRLVTDAVHRHGAKIFSQLTHGGHTSVERPPHIMWGPTQMAEPYSNFVTKAMDRDDIAACIDGFVASARNAVDAGFDGIEIKVGHDGLLRSFASPYFNRRTDEYGGSFENRMRLPMEVVSAVRDAIGPEIALGVRVCVTELTLFGYDEEYGLQMARAFQSSGLVDYLNSDAGLYSSMWMQIPPAAVRFSDLRRINVALKEAATLPVIAFGRMNPKDAEDMVLKNEADFIGMARPLIADPEIPNKLASGRGHLVRYCIACNGACLYQMAQEKDIRCVQNPAAGRERYVDEANIPPAPNPLRVVVVGAGPAGMKAAEIAAKRGHRVTIVEREKMLGGQVRLAEKQPEHSIIGEVAAYLEAVLSELNVEIRRGVEADRDYLAGLDADCIIVATGSEPNLASKEYENSRSIRLGLQVFPEIPDLPFIVSSDDVLKEKNDIRGRVLVIDHNGHWEGAGTAEFLADRGCEVHVVTSRFHVLEDAEAGVRALFLRRASIKGIKFHTTMKVLEIETARALIAPVYSAEEPEGWGKYVLFPGDGEWLENLDWVVPVIGRRSREDLYFDLKDDSRFADVRIERVGDCVSPRLVQVVLGEAYALSLNI